MRILRAIWGVFCEAIAQVALQLTRRLLRGAF